MSRSPLFGLVCAKYSRGHAKLVSRFNVSGLIYVSTVFGTKHIFSQNQTRQRRKIHPNQFFAILFMKNTFVTVYQSAAVSNTVATSHMWLVRHCVCPKFLAFWLSRSFGLFGLLDFETGPKKTRGFGPPKVSRNLLKILPKIKFETPVKNNWNSRNFCKFRSLFGHFQNFLKLSKRTSYTRHPSYTWTPWIAAKCQA